MEFKFNSYNEDYIMITRYNIFYTIACLDSINNKSKEEMEIFKTFINIQNSINRYEQNMRKKKIYYTNMFNIAINKDSTLGKYILANQKKPEYITIEEIIHALLVCINRSDWQYYNEISNLIKTYGEVIQNKKEEKQFLINYETFQQTVGEEITNYIINSKLYYTKKSQSDKKVHLYKNNKIIMTELPKTTKTNPKTKVKTIN